MFQNSFNLSLDALILRWKLFPLVKGGEGQYGTAKKKKKGSDTSSWTHLTKRYYTTSKLVPLITILPFQKS